MLRRLLLVATSAICLGALAALALASLAASERDVLMAARRDLKTEAAAVEADWRRTGAELAQLSVNTAGDATLGFDVRALAAAVESYDPDGRLADVLAQRIDSVRARLSERLLQFRHINPEVESVAIMNTDGQVLAANSARWTVGQSVLPTPGSDEPVAPLPEFMLKGLTGTPQAGVWVEKNAVWWVSVAPIWARPAGKDPTAQPTLAGIALLEQPLRSLPEGLGVSAFVMVDGELLIGTPPKSMRALPPTPEPFLLAAREAHARLLDSSLPFKPLFVNPGHVGVWAQRLHVPGTDRAHGAVMLDLTDLYSAMATRQLRVLCGTLAAWIVVAVMLFVSSRPRTIALVQPKLGAPPQTVDPAAVPVAPVAPVAAPFRAMEAQAEVDGDGYAPLDLRDVPFDDSSPPPDADDPLAGPADAVALVRSFMAGEPLGQTKATRAVLGDLLDTVPAATGSSQARGPHRSDEDTGPIKLPAKDKPLTADPEETTGPIKLPVKDKAEKPAPPDPAATTGLLRVPANFASSPAGAAPPAASADEQGEASSAHGPESATAPPHATDSALSEPNTHAPLTRPSAFGGGRAFSTHPHGDDAEASHSHSHSHSRDDDDDSRDDDGALRASSDAHEDDAVSSDTSFEDTASTVEAEGDPPAVPQESARDQLMAMLQAKARGAHAAASQSVPEPDPSPFEHDISGEFYRPQQEPLAARVGVTATDETASSPFDGGDGSGAAFERSGASSVNADDEASQSSGESSEGADDGDLRPSTDHSQSTDDESLDASADPSESADDEALHASAELPGSSDDGSSPFRGDEDDVGMPGASPVVDDIEASGPPVDDAAGDAGVMQLQPSSQLDSSELPAVDDTGALELTSEADNADDEGQLHAMRPQALADDDSPAQQSESDESLARPPADALDSSMVELPPAADAGMLDVPPAADDGESVAVLPDDDDADAAAERRPRINAPVLLTDEPTKPDDTVPAPTPATQPHAPAASSTDDDDGDTQPAARIPGFGSRGPRGSQPLSVSTSHSSEAAGAATPLQRSPFFGAATPLARPPATAPTSVMPAAGDPYRKVYEEFVATRQACGEAGDLPYGKFVQRLEATRADVLAKHNCADVEFSAYVKNGKAALKVTPR